jgi:glycosyltransferase involved in cell wall biosynthesis
VKILIITHCHKNFGGWYRAKNVAKSLEGLGVRTKLVSSPHHYTNPLTRVTVGLRNCWELLKDKAEMVHIFELIMPETLLPALFCKVLRKKVVIDIADEWLDSPTYHNNKFLRAYIRFIHTKLIKIFPFITVPCAYLEKKMHEYTKSDVYKLQNGVDTSEFDPVPRKVAR